MNRAEELKEIIYKHDYNYYELAKPIISDYEYDQLVKELFELTGEIPLKPSGFINEKFTKVKHNKKMLSLENSYSISDIELFKRRILRIKPDWDGVVNIQNKLDGLACSIHYENGILKMACTRGDGEFGENITENVKACLNVPGMLNEPLTLEVRGELIISKNNFKHINSELAKEEQYSNPRNLCSGTMRSLDPQVVRDRFVEFVPYYLDLEGMKTHTEELIKLQTLGFDLIKTNYLICNIDSLASVIESAEKNRASLEYEIDGQVIKVDCLETQKLLGVTSKFPKHSIAYKFETEKVETKILSVDYQIGKTGAITPVANLEPIEISGSIVSRASLHNFDEIKRKDIKIGDIVLVEKAAEIIPYIISVNKDLRTGEELEITVPEKCPICGNPTNRNKDEVAYYCTSDKCDEIKIQKLIYQTSKDCLNIDGLSEKTIRTFYELGFLKSLSDLIYLSTRKEQLVFIKGFGKKSIERILNSIENCKELRPQTILNTLDINLIGRSASRKLLEKFKSIESLLKASKEQILALDGFGEAVYDSIQLWKSNKTNLDNLELFKSNGFKTEIEATNQVSTKNLILKDKTICITGSFESFNRNELSQKLIELGAKVTNSVTSKTNYLICGEKAGSKLKKAEELKIKIIKEGEIDGFIKGIFDTSDINR